MPSTEEDMKKLVLLLPLLFVLAACRPTQDKSKYIRLLEERISNQEATIRNLNATIEDLKRELDLAKAKNERDEVLIANLEKRIQELMSNRYQLEVDIENLVKSLKAAEMAGPVPSEEPPGETAPSEERIGDGIVLVKPHDGKPAKLVIAGRVLFPSGEYRLSEAGEKALLKIAKILKEKTGDSILRVDGHTDNVRVRRPNDKGIIDNAHLSALRAYSVYSFLVKKGGISPKRIFFAAWGANKPIADNSTEEGRRKNRRVEILILPPDGPIVKPKAAGKGEKGK